jgi:hypothetical protein
MDNLDISRLTEKNLNYIKFETINNNNCSIINRYCIQDNGLLNTTSDINDNICENKKIVEVEFLLKLKGAKIEDCFVNIVSINKDDYKIFKNSVVFVQDGDKIPYRYSGNGGYLNNFPLKIYSENKKKVYNEFYIVGRDNQNDEEDNQNKCRDDQNIYHYLYNIDKPIYFKQDYSYSCKLNKKTPKETTLYKKILEITKIAKYGSSSYINADKEDNPDWITVDKSNWNEDDKHIIMNIYIKKKKQGFHSFKIIDKVIIRSSSELNNIEDPELKFDIKFEDSDDENNETKYNKEPEKPLFIPNIPEDILDPLFYSDVDK